jgi:hypothetical protein
VGTVMLFTYVTHDMKGHMITCMAGSTVKGKAVLVTGHEGPYGCRDVEAPTFSRHSAHSWLCGCPPYSRATFPPPPPAKSPGTHSC